VAARRDRRILLPQRPGRGVARVDVFLPAGRRRALLQRFELGIGHVNLAANVDARRPAPAPEAMRNVGDGPEVFGDVLAHIAVAARRTTDEFAILVAQRSREAVDLRLGREYQLEVLVALEEPARAL